MFLQRTLVQFQHRVGWPVASEFTLYMNTYYFFLKKDTSQLCVVYQKLIINIKTYIHYRERKRDVNLMVIKRKVVLFSESKSSDKEQ